METKLFVGVDVSKDSLDVAIGTQKDIITFANDQKGVDALVKKLSRIDPGLTVFSLPAATSFWQPVRLPKPGRL